jgi:GAF domain-containing protein
MDDTPLVPILRTDDGQVDPVALATWHEALSNTVAVEVPHDLMGLWLYPAHGGVVLLAPSELAQDDLIMPVPAPQLNPEQLSALEDVVQKAGYGSVTCLPVRFGKRDVALLLVANLEPNRYGEVERSVLQCVAQRIGPLLGRVARQWKLGEGRSLLQQERLAGLLETVARANRDASTPQRFIATLSHGLAALLPHEHIELLLPDKTRGGYFRLGEHAGGALWGDPSLIIDAEHLNIADIFGARSRLLVADTYEDGRWPRGFLTASEPAGADIRALVGARLNLRGKTSAYLLVGSIGSDLYGEDDLELLVLLAGLITPQIAGFIPTEQPPSQVPAEPAAPKPSAAPAAAPEHEAYAELLSRVAGLLATTADWSVVTQLVASEAISVLPCDKLTFVLRVTGGERVVVLDPGERRPLSSLPLISVTGTALARVLQGSLPCAFEQHDAETRLSVPLRVAGRIHGALTFSAMTPKNLTERHVVPIQHLADVVAAHLELLRRTSLQPHPTVSQWRHHQSSVVSRQSSAKSD